MLFLYELKKILKRIAPIWILVFILSVSSVTMIATASFFNKSHETIYNPEAYISLQNRVNNWDEPRQEQMSSAFNIFYEKYKIMNASTYNSDLILNYNEAKNSFQNFYLNYYKKFIEVGTTNVASEYLLIKENHFYILEDIMSSLNFFLTGEKNENEIREGLIINTKWEDSSLQEILNTIYIQQIKPDDLLSMRTFFANNSPSKEAYDYISNKYMLAVSNASEFNGHLSVYNGFENFINEFTSNGIIKLAEKQLENKDHGLYSSAFVFGNIYNNSGKVSIFDFIFTNMEMAMIPILILVIILTACVFFTDIYQNTIITTLSTRRNRSSVLVSKLMAVLTLTIGILLLFTTIFFFGSIVFFDSYLAPDILCLFNGTTAVIISQINYFILYFLSLLIKILPFIAIAGLFSFSKADPLIIVGLSLLVASTILLSNAFLGGFAFYQFIPLLALDPLKFFGATMFISPTPHIFNILYTLPVILLITIYLYLQLMYNFKKKDFQ